MRYLMLACDYDGTIAHNGRVDEPTLTALTRVRQSGRKLLLITGRELDDLQAIFPHLELFDRVVAENGALLYSPETREEKVLSEAPSGRFVEELVRRGVGPISVGRVIVATWTPHENTVLEVIRDLGLEMQVIFNKGAVMVLPSGVNKASGLTAALAELGLSPHNTVGVGDAENDHAFLSLCEFSVAVANALPTVKERANWVTSHDHGAGTTELIDQLLATDLAEFAPLLEHQEIPLGITTDGSELKIPPYGVNLLLAGSSQGGKTTLATGFIERLLKQNYQLCVIDPEGDYSELEDAVVLGDGHRPPTADEVMEVLAKPDANVVVNLLGISLEHRPAFFVQLFPRLLELRAQTGRPHWIVVDETHHLLGADFNPASITLPQNNSGILMITVEPEHVATAALSLVDMIIVIGDEPERTIREFCAVVGDVPPSLPPVKLEKGDALVWSRRAGVDPIWIRSLPPSGVRRRHHRKYVEGELSPELSFYFRGPEGKLNLRAQNLMVFLKLADGVDDETWLYHLRRGEYADWFRAVIKDDSLADEALRIGMDDTLSAQESRAQIRQAIERRYTAPA